MGAGASDSRPCRKRFRLSPAPSPALRSFAPTRPVLDGQVVLVTGGTGSFGRRFVRRVLAEQQPRKLIVFSRDELKQYDTQAELREAFPPETVARTRFFL